MRPAGGLLPLQHCGRKSRTSRPSCSPATRRGGSRRILLKLPVSRIDADQSTTFFGDLTPIKGKCARFALRLFLRHAPHPPNPMCRAGRAPCSLHGARCGPAGHRAYDWLVANPQLVQSRRRKLNIDSASRRRQAAGAGGQAKSHPAVLGGA